MTYFSETLSKQAAAQLQRAHTLLRRNLPSAAPLTHAQQALSSDLLLLLPRSQGGLQSPTTTENGSSGEGGAELSPDSIAAASPPRRHSSDRSSNNSLHAPAQRHLARVPHSTPGFIIPKVVESSASDNSSSCSAGLSSSALRSALSIMASAADGHQSSRQHSSLRAPSSPHRGLSSSDRASSSDAALQRTGGGFVLQQRHRRKGSSRDSSSSRSSAGRGKESRNLPLRPPSAAAPEDSGVSQEVGSDRAAGSLILIPSFVLVRGADTEAALAALRRVVHHLRNLTEDNASSSNGSGSAGGDEDLSAVASHALDGVSDAVAAATVTAANAAAVASSVAALGERQRQCRSIVKTLTEQHEQLLQAIEEEASRARAQAVEAASEWNAAHGNSMRLAQQQLQASAAFARLSLQYAPCAIASSHPHWCRPSRACESPFYLLLR